VSPGAAWLHELVVAPAAFALAACHARRALGAYRAGIEMLSLGLYGFALEWVAMRVFASHSYGDAWALAPLGVPLAVAAVWAALIPSALALVGRIGYASPLGRGGAAALLGIALDLLMEPVAVRTGLWRWTPPGPWLEIPVGNFVGWGVVVGGWAWGAEAWGRAEDGVRHVLGRVALGTGVLLALLAVGSAWRTFAAELLFEGAAGWMLWAVLLVLAGALRLKRRVAVEGPTLAGRLAVAPGPLPGLVIVLIFATFAADALRLGGVLVTLAAGSALVVLSVLRPRPY
jgi:hypothetical protein